MKTWLKKVGGSFFSIAILAYLLIPGASLAMEKAETQIHYPEGKIINIPHRGASGHAPEHTMPSYELGEQFNGNYIEVDLQMTKDDILIGMHDETVDRTTDGSGLVKNMTLEEIKELDAGSWFNEENPEKAKDEYVGLKVLSLEEIFQRFGSDSYYYIETKSPDKSEGMEEALLSLLEEYNLSNNVIVQSFSADSLKLIHSMDSHLPLVQLVSKPALDEGTEEELNEIKEYAIGVGPNFNNINENYVQTVREHGLHIHPYTVNKKEQMRTALEWGVTGLFSNYPDRFDEVITEFTNTSYIKSLIEYFDEQGEMNNEEAVHALNLHLTAVEHYEDRGAADKVVKHLNGFKDLLNHYADNEIITDHIFDSLSLQADLLIEKWEE